MFGSWDNKRAIDYRRKNKIDDSLGTAVNIQAMVFGNKGDDSGTGVAFTRNPANGDPTPYGDYLVNAQGEDVVAGIRNTMKLAEMGEVQPQAWAELQGHLHTLEGHYKDMCDIEFTVEQGKLWLLQTRVGKRTAFAEWIMAHDMVDRGADRPRHGHAAPGRQPARGAVQEGHRRRRRWRGDRLGPERLPGGGRRQGACSAPTTPRNGPSGASR